MSEPTELLPCPFCGDRGDVGCYDDEHWTAECSNPDCECSVTGILSKQEAINFWNRRANRWDAFTSEELANLRPRISLGYRWNSVEKQIEAEIHAELARRQSTGENK